MAGLMGIGMLTTLVIREPQHRPGRDRQLPLDGVVAAADHPGRLPECVYSVIGLLNL